MMMKVKYSTRFKKGLRLAAKRGLDISLLEDIGNAIFNRIGY